MLLIGNERLPTDGQTDRPTDRTNKLFEEGIKIRLLKHESHSYLIANRVVLLANKSYMYAYVCYIACTNINHYGLVFIHRPRAQLSSRVQEEC